MHDEGDDVQHRSLRDERAHTLQRLLACACTHTHTHTRKDPTDGYITYVSEEQCRAAGIINVTSTGAVRMSVDAKSVASGPRDSVRLTSKASYNGGLFVLGECHDRVRVRVRVPSQLLAWASACVRCCIVYKRAPRVGMLACAFQMRFAESRGLPQTTVSHSIAFALIRNNNNARPYRCCASSHWLRDLARVVAGWPVVAIAR
jgi:hypothetical protein